MKILKLNEVIADSKTRSEVVKAIKTGRVFVYPTDTVYGLGCNAGDDEAVWKIRTIKKSQKPFSVVAPSKEWMLENFIIRFPEYLDKLPGPYTLVLEKRIPMLKAANRPNTLGIRIPKHPFTKIIEESGLPFITTSANISTEETIKEISEIPDRMKERVDYAIDGGVINNPPSQVIDLTGEKLVILRDRV